MSAKKTELKTITEIMENRDKRSTLVSTSTEDIPHTVFMPCVHDPLEGVWWGITKSGWKSSNRMVTFRKDNTKRYVEAGEGRIAIGRDKEFFDTLEEEIAINLEALSDF